MMVRTTTFCTIICLTLVCALSANADVVNFVIDAAQSSTEITISGSTDQSQTSGSGVLYLTPSTPPFGVAQITDLNIVLDDGLNFSFLGGFVSGSTAAGDVMIDLLTPGAAGVVSANQFDQTGNQMGLGGDVNIVDPFNLVGGSTTVDLSTIAIDPVDFNDLTLSRLGDVVTISGNYNIVDDIDVGGTLIPIVINGNFVASGIVTVPEPSGMVVLLTTLGFVTLRRRRS